MPKPTQAEVSDLVGRLRAEYCSCHEGFKSRNLTDPQCESCSTKFERNEAADAIEALAGEGAEPVDASGWRFVPIEPTLEMLCAAAELRASDAEDNPGGQGAYHTMGELWAAMLYAAPPAKPAGELPPLPDLKLMAHVVVARAIEDAYCSTEFKRNALKEAWEEFDRAYALRALRERA